MYTEGNKILPYTDNDIKLFLAYFYKVKSITGLSNARILIQSGIRRNYVYQLESYLKGSKWHKVKKSISIYVFIRIYDAFKIPFNMSDYLHILEDNK